MLSRRSWQVLLAALVRIVRWRRLRTTAVVLATSGLLFAASLAFWPPPDPYQVKPPGVRVLDRNGRLLRGYLSPDQQRRWRLEIAQISPALIEAVVQHEDRRFRWHPGVDPVAVARAAWDNLRSGRVTSGASTLTMQLVRLVEPRPRSLGYKLYQSWRALQYEALYSKDEILAWYLNLAPCGGNVEGVGAAAQVYFGKPAGELSVAEACLLAVLPQSPSRRQPVTYPDAARFARDGLIGKLAACDRIDPALAAEALTAPLPTKLQRLPFIAPHFCDWLRLRHAGQANLLSTVDLGLQRRATELLADHVADLRPRGIHQAAAVILHAETGEVLALVGSADFGDARHQGQVNGAVARRSPGSTLKPFVYALAFDRGLATPTTLLADVPVRYADYVPSNFDGRFRGAVSVGNALRESLNVPAVNLAADLERTGQGGLYDLLKDAGVMSLDQTAGHYGLSLVLGGGDVTLLELASLYATLARGGIYRPWQGLLTNVRHDPEVDPSLPPAPDSDPDGELLMRRVLSAEAAWLTLHELTGVKRPQAETLWTGARSRTTVAWKTGTSYGHRDAWSVGVVGPYVVGVWVGNFAGGGSPHLVGSEVAAPLLFALVEALPQDQPAAWLHRPTGLARHQVCALSGAAAGPHCRQTVTADYAPGISPAATCRIHRLQQIDTATGSGVCSRCRTAGRWANAVVEVWPPEIATYLTARQVAVPALAPHDPNCSVSGLGENPVITSPGPDTRFRLRGGVPLTDQAIALQATAGSDNRRLFWFVDGELFREAQPGETLFLPPSPGRHRISVVDEAGRSAATEIFVTS